MDQITDVRALVGRGNELLLKGQAAEAAADFARAVQLDASMDSAHLGVAQANLALGAYGIVSLACRKVIELAPGTADAGIAQAILYLLDRRYDTALVELDHADSLDPGRPYVHAMRGYCLRRMGNSYDAQLAEAKAARLSSSRELGKLFPAVEAAPQPTPDQPAPADPGVPGRITYQRQRTWNERSRLERQMVRARFATRTTASVTLTLIAINVAIFLLGNLAPRTGDALLQFGVQEGDLIQQDPTQAYRIVTAMFLHANFAHIFLNMISLYSLGIAVEALFGKWRYLLIYFAAGIAGGIVQAIVTPTIPSLGASGAIFGVFGAFGAFALLLRRQLGPAGNSLVGQWIFFLALNLIFGFTVPGIGIWDHIGGLAVGFLLGALFVNQSRQRRRSF
jgi:membrane associated rhomboid family serine protease